mmetsp:Transcript_17408/g.22628  ORF Transcript_17408/g.22628 Transcript_17408/m.22628 type:complete len:177 (+) Transcript_17408:496-1026(+)
MFHGFTYSYTTGYIPVCLGNVETKLTDACASFFCKEHAEGLLNPKNGAQFDESKLFLLNEYQVFNALHRSLIEPGLIVDFGLPPGRANLKSCTVQELRAMLNARDGNTVSENGNNMTKKDLYATMKAFIRLEEKAPSLVQAYDKNTTSSGTYKKSYLQRMMQKWKIISNNSWIHSL